MLKTISFRSRLIVIVLFTLPVPMLAALLAIYFLSRIAVDTEEVANKHALLSNATITLAASHIQQTALFERAVSSHVLAPQPGDTTEAFRRALADFRAASTEAGEAHNHLRNCLTSLAQTTSAPSSESYKELSDTAFRAAVLQDQFNENAHIMFTAMESGSADPVAAQRPALNRLQDELRIQVNAALTAAGQESLASLRAVARYDIDALKLLVAMTVIGLFGSGVLAIAVSAAASRPIENAVTLLQRLAQGETDVPINDVGRRRDQLAVLTRSIAQFRDALVERQRVEEELRQSDERFRAFFENTPIGSIVIDSQGTVEVFNKSASQIFGYRADQVVGRNVSMLMPAPHHGQHDDYIANYILSGDARVIGIGRKVTGIRSTGEAFPMQLGVSEVFQGGKRAFIGSVTDLTEQKLLEGQLRQSQKMEAIGQLTGGIAHDFNNILGIIQGNLQILRTLVADNPDAQDRIDKALKGATRGAGLTRRLLGFAHGPNTGVKLHNANAVIAGMEDLIARSLTAAIRIETNLSPGLWPVRIDSGELEDAILNLALNARDAMPDGGVLAIETKNTLVSRSQAEQLAECRPGEYVLIAVRDSGVGMSPAVKAMALEPFFSTKAPGKGTGLGLSMVYGFATRSGGTVEIDSSEGHGAVIRMYLPRAQGVALPESGSTGDAGVAPTGSETILVVDDEADLLDVAVSHLRQLGYNAIGVANGEQALAVLDRRHDIDLVFTDVVIPGQLDGYRLAELARRNRPHLKILITSGYSRAQGATPDASDSGTGNLTADLLRKPYGLTDLAFAIRHALDGKAGKHQDRTENTKTFSG